MDIFKYKFRGEIEKALCDYMKEHGSGESLIEGTFKRDLVNANAVEFEKTYTELNLLRDAAFASTSWGDYLTQVCSDYGIDRKLAEKAKGKVKLTGSPRALIPEKSLFQTGSGLRFYSIQDESIDEDGTATIEVVAEIAGSIYNVQPHEINLIPMSIAGVRTVDNPEIFKGGYDTETDEQLYSRYYDKVRTPATSGNMYHYRQWALSVPGVGNCKVYPLKHGNGTVEIAIIDSNGTRANEELITRVREYVESVRPIGAKVTVVTPEALIVNITVTKAENANLEDFKKRLVKFFSLEGFKLDKVSKANIAKALLNSGCTDYEEILLNGQSKNIALEYKLPVLGEVRFND